MLTASDIPCIARAMAPFARTVALYASLPRDEHGRMLRRHAITDLENSDPTDLVEFGKLGGICEVYPQILTLDRREDCLSMMRRQIGETRLLHSWNRRGMEDSGCTVCCGTDLPLLIPSPGRVNLQCVRRILRRRTARE